MRQIDKLFGLACYILLAVKPLAADTKPETIELISGLKAEVFEDSVRIKGDRELTAKAELLQDPPRYVLDIAGFQMYKPRTYVFPSHERFIALRSGSHEGFLRLVFDLKSKPETSPKFTQAKEALEISFSKPSSKSEYTGNESLNTQDVQLRFSVSDLVVNIPYNARPIYDLKVKNRSSSPLFITALAEQVFNAGKESEKRESTRALLVSPKRFELEPDKERLVRLVVVSHDEEEESVFRINFIPDTEPFDPEKDASKKVQINAGLSVLAISGPKEPTAELSTEWDEQGLLLQNNGNSNIYLDRIKACKGEVCTDLSPKRLYAGAQWRIPGKELSSLEFLQKTGNDFENIVVKRP